MKKKYKLIKGYPNAPAKVGTVFSHWTDGVSVQYYNPTARCNYIPESTILKYPEFWEEVVEDPIVFHIGDSLTKPHPGGKANYYIYQDKKSYCKNKNIKYFYCRKDCEKWANEQVEKDYEILSFKQNSKIEDLWIFDSRGWCRQGNSTKPMSLEEILSCPNMYSIHSVKRLSDGKVFTVGDLCNPINVKYNQHQITKIEFCKAGYLRLASNNWYIGINDIEHSKIPLFTTKDGVSIYEGDKYWALVGFEIYYSEAREGCNFKNTFSTKEAAEKYMLMNKPCLSINDVLTVSYNPVETKSSTTKKLMNLVKNKMK